MIPKSPDDDPAEGPSDKRPDDAAKTQSPGPEQVDSSVNELLHETVIGAPKAPAADRSTQIGPLEDAVDSFSKYESTTSHGVPTALPQIGDRVVEKILGRGGMGVVYLAWHRKLSAMKLSR